MQKLNLVWIISTATILKKGMLDELLAEKEVLTPEELAAQEASGRKKCRSLCVAEKSG